MAIAVRSYSTLSLVGNQDATATPGPTIAAPAGLAVGDYLVIGVFFAQGVGSGSVNVPAGFTQITANGTSGNRLLVTYGLAITDSTVLASVASGISLRSGYNATRVAAIAAALTGVSSVASAATLIWTNSATTSLTHNPPTLGDTFFYFVASNSSSPSSSPAITEVGGTKVVQVTSTSAASPPYADSQIAMMIGGTGATFAASVANSGSVGFGLVATPDAPTNLPPPTRVGYSFLNPGINNTTLTLDPSSVAGGSAIADGHWMTAIITTFSTTTSITPPAGWTTLEGMTTTGTQRFAIYGKIRANGETTYAFTLSGNGTASSASLMWGTGANTDLTRWIVSPVTERSVDAHNSAAGMITSINHSLVFGISIERTTATEVGVTSVTGATEWFFMPQSGGSIQTIDVAYTDDFTPAGVTNAIEWVYPNSQATNGDALQIIIPPNPNAGTNIAVGYPGVVRIGTTNYSGKLFYWDGSAAHDFNATALVNFKPVTVTQFLAHKPWFSAHRGFSYSYPEETLYGYRAATDWGIKAIEVSVQKSADGTFWCFHDPTTTRTTGTTGTISAMTDATIAALNNVGTTATANPSQPARPTAKLVDVLNLYAATHVIIIEDKTYTNTTAMLNLMDSYGTVGRPANEIFIWKADAGSGAGFFSAPAGRGYHRWAYIFDASMAASFATLVTSGKADMIGMDFNSSDATLSAAIASCITNNVMPTGHIINSTAQRDRLLGLGMKGLMMSSKDAIPPWYNIW